MNMTDNEILRDYKQAKDKKEQVKILADLNQCSVWEMYEKLSALGAEIDGRSFQQYNPKREGLSAKGGQKTAEMKAADPQTITEQLRRQLREKEDIITQLKADGQLQAEQLRSCKQKIEDLTTAVIKNEASIAALRTEGKRLVLRDVLLLLEEVYSPLPDAWETWEDCRPISDHKVKIAFMCEEETHILTYPTHPILIPWYDCPVESIGPTKSDTLLIFLSYEKWIGSQIRRWRAK